MTAGGALGAFGGALLADTLPRELAEGEGRQAVACSRREAAEAARDVLQQGGNAIDAAVAALLVQCVIEPSNVGLGGYGGSLVYYQAKTGRVQTIDFDSRAPLKFDPSTFSEAAGRHGYLAVGAPGVVAGIDIALQQFGTLPFKTLAKPAMAHAAEGIEVTPRLASSFKCCSRTSIPRRAARFFRRACRPKGPHGCSPILPG